MYNFSIHNLAWYSHPRTIDVRTHGAWLHVFGHTVRYFREVRKSSADRGVLLAGRRTLQPRVLSSVLHRSSEPVSARSGTVKMVKRYSFNWPTCLRWLRYQRHEGKRVTSACAGRPGSTGAWCGGTPALRELCRVAFCPCMPTAASQRNVMTQCEWATDPCRYCRMVTADWNLPISLNQSCFRTVACGPGSPHLSLMDFTCVASSVPLKSGCPERSS
jgi:hypothetical protein